MRIALRFIQWYFERVILLSVFCSRFCSITSKLRAVGLCVFACFNLNCTVGTGEGFVRGDLFVPGCEGVSNYEMEPNFFGAVAIQNQLQIRIQKGGDYQEYADSVTISVLNTEEIFAHKLNQPIPVELERLPGSPPSVKPPFVRISLSLRNSCSSHIFNPGDNPYVVYHATQGTVTFTSIVHGDLKSTDTNSKRVEGTFDVWVEDPRFPERNPKPGGRIYGAFKFFYQKGGPAQPFQ